MHGSVEVTDASLGGNPIFDPTSPGQPDHPRNQEVAYPRLMDVFRAVCVSMAWLMLTRRPIRFDSRPTRLASLQQLDLRSVKLSRESLYR